MIYYFIGFAGISTAVSLATIGFGIMAERVYQARRFRRF